MVHAWWRWEEDFSDVGVLAFDFTVHNDPGDFSDRNGLYLMVCWGTISGDGFYFGLQTDVWDPAIGRGRGKGLVFSRWGERDLDDARVAEGEDTWLQEPGHEGDFVGVRRSYEWDEGDYRMWLAEDGEDADGDWYGVWLTDLDTNTTLWVGSLQFPLVDGETPLKAAVNSVVEIYGSPPVRPIDIPEWYVSMEPPEVDGLEASRVWLDYGGVRDQVLSNADIQYLDGRVHFRVGGDNRQVGVASEEYLDLRRTQNDEAAFGN